MLSMLSIKSVSIAMAVNICIIAAVIVNGSGWAALMDAEVVLGFIAYAWPFLLPMALILTPLVALAVEGWCVLFEKEPDGEES